MKVDGMIFYIYFDLLVCDLGTKTQTTIGTKLIWLQTDFSFVPYNDN